MFSHLVRFLRRVEEHSAENKMTASNLGICIGCSLLYPKEQLLNTPIPNTYTTGSTILELMISHYDELFQLNNQEDRQVSYRLQPDLIPISDHPVNDSIINNNYYFFFYFIEKSC